MLSNPGHLKHKLLSKMNITVLIQDCEIFCLLTNVPANKILLVNGFLMYFGGYFLVHMKDTLGKLKYQPISFVSSTNTPIHLYPLNKIGLCCYCLFHSA